MVNKKKAHPQSKKIDFFIAGVAVACVVIAIVMIVVLLNPKTEQMPFTPPAYDANARTGIPVVEETLHYSVLSQAGMAYAVGICGNVRICGTQADVYLTNVAENEVLLKLRVLNASGEILGETGVIRPGEYVPGVSLQRLPEQGEKISLKVMSYTCDEYLSMGCVVLTPTLTFAD